MLKTNQIAASARPRDKKPSHSLGEFRSPGLLGRRPLIGLVMVLLGVSLFGALAVNLETHGPLIQADTQILNSIHALALRSPPFILGVMKFGFYFAQYGFVLIGAVLVLYFLYKRFWAELSMVLIAWAGEGPLWFLLSGYFNRPRPEFATSVWRVMTVPSFPSGHSISAVMCFGLLAYLLMPKITSYFWKAVLIVVTLLAIIYVGYSRLFVGDHYPTDVLAGYALGIAWSGFVYTAIELVARRKRMRKKFEDDTLRWRGQ
jgi:membrane-associated phospholipid phosphatase